MKFSIVFLCAFALFVCNSVNAKILTDIRDKLIPSFATGYIINGRNAEPQAAPYIVSLGDSSLLHSHKCGGTIIHKDWVLTAAHCISKPVGMSVVAGLHNRTDFAGEYVQKRKVDFGQKHKLFSGGVGPFDIAILHVSESFVLTAGVQIAALPSQEEIHAGATQLYGWGQPKAYQFSPANTLQTVDTQIVEWNECKEQLPKNAKLDPTNICSDSLKQGISACNGDSGGPLVQEKKNAPTELIGIVSWGFIPCGKANLPSVYTRVSAYIDWIADMQSAYYALH